MLLCIILHVRGAGSKLSHAIFKRQKAWKCQRICTASFLGSPCKSKRRGGKPGEFNHVWVIKGRDNTYILGKPNTYVHSNKALEYSASLIPRLLHNTKTPTTTHHMATTRLPTTTQLPHWLPPTTLTLLTTTHHTLPREDYNFFRWSDKCQKLVLSFVIFGRT